MFHKSIINHIVINKRNILGIWKEMKLTLVDDGNIYRATTSSVKPDVIKLPLLTIFYNISIHVLLYGYTIYLTYISVTHPITLFTLHAPLSALGVSIKKKCFFIKNKIIN